MNCYNCGAEYSKNNIFCLECGAELTDKIFNNNVEYYNDCLNIKLCGNTISFSAEILEYNELFGNFITLGEKSSRKFENFYKMEITTFDKLYEKCLPVFVEKCSEAFRFGIFVLMEYGIDYIDEQALLDMFDEDELKIEFVLEQYVTFAEQIQETAEQLNSYRATQRAMRGSWQGGGFGIKGAIKGALTASALNLATNAVRGIGDSITDSKDRAKLENIKNTLIKEKSNSDEMSNVILATYISVFHKVSKILYDNQLLPPVDFSIGNLDARINNYMSMYNAGQDVYNKLTQLLTEAIECYPFDYEYYLKLYRIAPRERRKVTALALFFHSYRFYFEGIHDFDVNRLNAINSMKEIDQESILLKINAYERLSQENPTIKTNDELNRLRNAINQQL